MQRFAKQLHAILLPFLAAGLFDVSCAARADTCTIVSGGKPQAAIVLADKGFPVDTYAAQELQYHVERATGAKLGIYREASKPSNFASIIYIGDCSESRRRGLRPDSLPANAGFIRNIGSDLFFTGNDGDGPPLQDQVRAGSLFAVYTFLENHLGVRWLWPGKLGEVVPSRADLVISNLQETHKPTLIHSRFRAGGALTGPADAWSAATSHGHFYQEEVVWLRRHQFGRAISLDIRHSFTGYWARFGQNHPEYFNLLPDGERHPDPLYARGDPSFVSMNVSDPGLWRQIVSDWKAHRTEFAPYIDASENDTFGKDLTPATLAWDVPDPSLHGSWNQRVARAKKAFERKDPLWPLELGSLSDRYARFWMEVQKEAQKDDPNATVMGFAYDNYVEPPIRTRLNDHIIMGIVPPIAFPYTEAMRTQFRRVWDGWSKAGARLMFRPNMYLEGYTMPIFFARKFAEDYTYAYEHGMIASDFDSLTGQWATQGPNLYVLGRLNEHPDWSADRILEEYYDGFGPAKADVRAYFEHWEHVTDNTKVEAGDPFQFYKTAPSVFTPSVMAQGRSLLERAARAAANNSVAKQRVTFLENGLRHAELALETESARKRGDTAAFKKSLGALEEFRAHHESDLIADMGFLELAERSSWDRTGVPRPNPANIGRKPVVGPNLLTNGDFQGSKQGWSSQVMAGECTFATDASEHHSGQMSARIDCKQTVPASSNSYKRSAWARFYQVNIPIQKGASYRLSVWVKTSKDFHGEVLVWCESNGVSEGKTGTTNGEWKQVVIDDFQPKADTASVYLNLTDSTGSVWFDDARLEQISNQKE